jgi:NAD(P)-dependent dehydrogenase (short-subunit alcohol dehydrogenase family)
MSFNPKNIAVVGASGAIGSAFVNILSQRYPQATLHAFSQHSGSLIDYKSEDSIANAAAIASANFPIDCVIVANGVLHAPGLTPEKSLKDCSAQKFHDIFQINTIVPAMIAKHFLPKLNAQESSRFAVLSARVGSISDNQLGGWYAYRASKAALNMFVKTAAIEIGRRNKHAVIVALHPGTVDSPLSQPFQAGLPEGQLFTPEDAVQKLIDVIVKLKAEQSGKFFAYDGEEIAP